MVSWILNVCAFSSVVICFIPPLGNFSLYIGLRIFIIYPEFPFTTLKMQNNSNNLNAIDFPFFRLYLGPRFSRTAMSLSRDTLQIKPREAREQFRKGNLSETPITCSQFCAGYLQANIACVPSDIADDFERLCLSNSSPFPLLYRSKPGEVSAPPLASNSDVR